MFEFKALFHHHLSQSLITKETSPLGYQLLKCIRIYQEVDTILAFEVHTVETLKMLEKKLAKLQNAILVKLFTFIFKYI